MANVFHGQGRTVTAEQMQWLQAWVPAHPDWSRKRFARELCAEWQWHNERGQPKDFAARSFLLKLAAGGYVQLPALRIHKRRPRRAVTALVGWEEPAPWAGCLADLQPLQVAVVVAGTETYQRWAFYLETYHYLGFRVVGENLGYVLRDRQGRELGGLLFGAPAWRCRVRDAFLHWSPVERAAQLSRLANNTRFLILPWIRVPQLASHALGQVTRRINRDWQAKYGHELRWLETFVDTERYRGTCYRAANWQYAGHTTGRSRQDRQHRLQVSRKAVYLYPLHSR